MVPEVITGIVVVILLCGFGLSFIRSITGGKQVTIRFEPGSAWRSHEAESRGFMRHATPCPTQDSPRKSSIS